MLLKTKQITIRNMNIKDIDNLYLVYSNGLVMKYIEPVFDKKKTREFVEKYGLSENPLIYSIEFNANKQVIGHFIFHKYDSKSNEIGWIINKEYWDKGIASEILQAVIEKQQKDLIIECDSDNEKVIHIAQKFGFKNIGIIDELVVFERSVDSYGKNQ